VDQRQIEQEAGRLIEDLKSHVKERLLYGDDGNFVRFTNWFINELENLFLDYDCLRADGLVPGCGRRSTFLMD